MRNPDKLVNEFKEWFYSCNVPNHLINNIGKIIVKEDRLLIRIPSNIWHQLKESGLTIDTTHTNYPQQFSWFEKIPWAGVPGALTTYRKINLEWDIY